jgi:nucleotide-binding universal stress UspA family protein
MTIASILAVADGGDGSEGVLDLAFKLGARFDAYTEVLHVKVNPADVIPVVGEGMSGAMVDRMMSDLSQTAEQQSAQARRLFEDHCAAVDMPPREAKGTRAPGQFAVAWRQLVGREAEEVAKSALFFDLAIIAQPPAQADGNAMLSLEAVLFESGRPALVAPPSPGPDIGRRVMIAWNASREAARAVSDALPILARAEAVTIVGLDCGDALERDPAALADFLALHGCQARALTGAAGKPTGQSLLAEAERLDADLLVMGAYGHSRLREFILGGATRDVLRGAGLPVLMAH